MNVFLFAALIILLLLALQAWRFSDEKHAQTAWNELRRKAQVSPADFDPANVDALPEPARRYFR